MSEEKRRSLRDTTQDWLEDVHKAYGDMQMGLASANASIRTLMLILADKVDRLETELEEVRKEFAKLEAALEEDKGD